MSASLRCFKQSRKLFGLGNSATSSSFRYPRTSVIRQARFATESTRIDNTSSPPSAGTSTSDSAAAELGEGKRQPTSSSSTLPPADSEPTARPERTRRPRPTSRTSSTYVSPTRFTRKPDIPSVEPYFAEHLNGVFEPLVFPPELARRILTHGSHPAAMFGHNGAYSFIGRRVLDSYLLLFLSSSAVLRPTHDVQQIATQTLHTYTLGEFVGSQWGLGRVLRWTPTVSEEKFQASEMLSKAAAQEQEARTVMRGTGLYKVQGDAVAAVMGGIFSHFGGAVAHRVFHTHLLPLLAIHNKAVGLPQIFHEDVKRIRRELEGSNRELAFSKPSAGQTAPTYPVQQTMIQDAPRATPQKAVA
ncbi:hypothetical protein HGRIS_000585 [Hohenbuehelia grisea]|uniref:RNase III domain-containing protein n=1 Tax=Hohenbuehelia grisea TaxID=104357 RepID=A0ABR3JTI5_9AGAR